MSGKAITNEVFIAYSQCPRKAFLLLFSEEQGKPHDHPLILKERCNQNRAKYLESFRQEHTDVNNYHEKHFKKSDYLIEATLKSDNLEAYCDILEKIDSGSSHRKVSYEPRIITGTYCVTKEQKTELLFIGIVLGQIQKQLPAIGTIVGMDVKVQRVKLEGAYKSITPFLKTLQAWLNNPPIEPPSLILNKHCPSCQFRHLCREQAEKENSLSLLDRMTVQAIQKYNKKGIFTVHQLSYLFKPSINRKKNSKASLQHKLDLQALAIRENKIYIQELPSLTRKSLELFFIDIEGIPEQRFYYLIGLMVCNEQTNYYYYFWAETINDEKQIWSQLIVKLNEYPDAPVYHYGSYEPKAITELAKRYSTDAENLISRLININSYIYGKVYFPILSNSLKDIGNYIGFSWTALNASGLNSLAWRYQWEQTQSAGYQSMLINYNKEDCNALKAVLDKLSLIQASASDLSDIDFANNPKKNSTEVGQQIHKEFENILRLDRIDNKTIVSFKTKFKSNDKEKNIAKEKIHQAYKRIIPKSGKTINVEHEENCPKCKVNKLVILKTKLNKTIIDLVFSKKGCRKIVINYEGNLSYCRSCNYKYNPLGASRGGFVDDHINKFPTNQIYGHGLRSWIVYQRLVLRLPHKLIVQHVEDLFNEKVSTSSVILFMKYFSEYYAETEAKLTHNILKSSFIHIDETSISIDNVNQYVWIFTNGEYVIFKLTKTREASVVHELLENYSGTIITDFYAGYDTVNCKQQKCWIHLIRNLNNDLWNNPFNTEFELFVLEVKNLIVPIIEAIRKYDLKKRHLQKFKNKVEIFYKKNIFNKTYYSEVTTKYQKLFQRYETSLFLFIEEDYIPWNNNTAERGIIHLAAQRRVSRDFSATITPHYLLMLGISQTCKFQGKSLLQFLLSGEKDLDKFKRRTPIIATEAVTRDEEIISNTL
ncbi:TM0106 family RecB-like putative nuclease [Nostoc sp. FACHB-892]|uniref:TM0106 family RecB-like putative nuclease n=1 Tax=Nostoc sp. FACHB-892 TaxID=2692843 RepID=UPI0016856F40|nr:TM0106 family RecB-like putative nuclease [Nostoc sp. FACHB-892]MBD2731237.1 TM0106 family RecB-like putative nuclease [Nostoc sp. FACHB-892]